MNRGQRVKGCATVPRATSAAQRNPVLRGESTRASVGSRGSRAPGCKDIKEEYHPLLHRPGYLLRHRLAISTRRDRGRPLRRHNRAARPMEGHIASRLHRLTQSLWGEGPSEATASLPARQTRQTREKTRAGLEQRRDLLEAVDEDTPRQGETKGCAALSSRQLVREWWSQRGGSHERGTMTSARSSGGQCCHHPA